MEESTYACTYNLVVSRVPDCGVYSKVMRQTCNWHIHNPGSYAERTRNYDKNNITTRVHNEGSLNRCDADRICETLLKFKHPTLRDCI